MNTNKIIRYAIAAVLLFAAFAKSQIADSQFEQIAGLVEHVVLPSRSWQLHAVIADHIGVMRESVGTEKATFLLNLLTAKYAAFNSKIC